MSYRMTNVRVDIGSKYEETKSMLIKKLNDPLDVRVMMSENISDGHACYFCGEQIPSGVRMFEVTHCYRSDFGDINRSKYFVDEDCIREMTDRDRFDL